MNKIPTEKSGFNPNWQIKTLNEVCNKISAGGDKPDDCTTEKTEENQIPIFSNGIKNKGLCGYTKTPTITKPALTISARGTIGFACVRYEPFFPIVRLICVIPNEKLVVLEFLCYALQYIIPQGEGTSVPQLTIPNFKKIEIPIPPLDEQKRIASALSKIDAYLENTIKLIEEKERFKRGIAKKLLTCKEGENIPEARFKGFEDEWKETQILEFVNNNIIKIEKGKSITKSKIEEGDIPVIAGGKTPPYYHNKYNYNFPCITISASGSAGYVWFHDYKIWASDCHVIYTDNKRYNIKFLYHYLKNIQDLIYYLQVGGVQKHVYAKDLIKLNIPNITIEEQEKIGGYLSLLDKEIDNLKKQKELIKEMKRGAMQKLLSGEVRLLE
ncbi:restriction endonuclease subunit S [Brachyspira aalborgi]|uniref:Restriction endonuclease subunit S n=1 Tax=Brachyspira aalborgi TaxID=29522 RepID=A0A5C8ECU8_9SPIR|nr:restriction endonuclease subunit S [Brachyspira aalborgi]TXJ34894.1 restriction endonuclease subunit S [Brachyspira aalborgi]